MYLKKVINHKNILVAYHGGGYDGCIWEWNFFLFNSLGEFHNIYYSGCNGIKDEENCREFLQDESWQKDRHAYIYHLDNKNHIDDFQNSHAVPHVVAIVEKINEGEYGDCPEIWFICDKCGNKVTDYGFAEDRHGCGGIRPTADTKLCSDCLSSGTCSYCGEYTESVDEYAPFCKFCYEARLKDIYYSLDLQFIEYDKSENKFVIWDEGKPEILDDFDIENLFIIKAETKDAIETFGIEAPTEYLALEYLSTVVYSLRIISVTTIKEELQNI